MFESKKMNFDAIIVIMSKGLEEAEATKHSFGKRRYCSGGISLVEFLMYCSLATASNNRAT